MGIFGFGDLFFYFICIVTFSFSIFGIYKKNKLIAIAGILCMLTFISVKFQFKHIEDYYFNEAITTGKVIKSELKKYQKTNKEFPENLKILYGESDIPKYKIGLLKYSFRYYKTDTSYVLYFNFFGGKDFRNLGAYDLWTFYD
jgi:hypothetical protein